MKKNFWQKCKKQGIIETVEQLIKGFLYLTSLSATVLLIGLIQLWLKLMFEIF